ncbi:hypothetical protein AAC387_Pa06g3190 [Persea americana]
MDIYRVVSESNKRAATATGNYIGHDLSQTYRIFRFTSGLSLGMGSSAKYEEEKEDDDHPSVLDLCFDIYSSETGQWVKSKASFKRRP